MLIYAGEISQGLVASFFAIELQRFHHRTIAKGKQQRFIVAEFFMGMPLPERHDERIALAPLEIAFADLSATLAFDHMVERGAGMPVRLGGFLRIEKLNLAGHRWIGVTAGRWIDVTQKGPVVRIAIRRAHRLERFVCVLERVAERHAAPKTRFLLRRPRKAQAAK